MSVQTINPLLDGAWEDFVLSQPDASVFHSTAWARVLHDAYGFEPRYLAYRNGSGDIRAGLPLADVGGRRLVGLPFSDHCAPLLGGNGAGAAVLEAAKATL